CFSRARIAFSSGLRFSLWVNLEGFGSRLGRGFDMGFSPEYVFSQGTPQVGPCVRLRPALRPGRLCRRMSLGGAPCLWPAIVFVVQPDQENSNPTSSG